MKCIGQFISNAFFYGKGLYVLAVLAYATVGTDVGTGDFRSYWGFCTCGHAHVRSHLFPGMDCRILHTLPTSVKLLVVY